MNDPEFLKQFLVMNARRLGSELDSEVEVLDAKGKPMRTKSGFDHFA